VGPFSSTSASSRCPLEPAMIFLNTWSSYVSKSTHPEPCRPSPPDQEACPPSRGTSTPRNRNAPPECPATKNNKKKQKVIKSQKHNQKRAHEKPIESNKKGKDLIPVRLRQMSNSDGQRPLPLRQSMDSCNAAFTLSAVSDVILSASTRPSTSS